MQEFGEEVSEADFFGFDAGGDGKGIHFGEVPRIDEGTIGITPKRIWNLPSSTNWNPSYSNSGRANWPAIREWIPADDTDPQAVFPEDIVSSHWAPREIRLDDERTLVLDRS